MALTAAQTSRPGARSELDGGGGRDVGGDRRSGRSSSMRSLSPCRATAVTVAGQVLRGLPSGRAAYRATAEGGKATNTSPFWASAVISAKPSGEPDRGAVGPAAVEVEADQPGHVVGAGLGGDGGGVAALHDRGRPRR